MYIRERGIIADLSLVHAHTADLQGNLKYRFTARNFNPLVAAAGEVTIVQAEHILGPSEFLDPDSVTTSGIFVNGLIQASSREKQIEQRTVRERPTPEKV